MAFKPKPETFLAEVEKFPPFKCWLLARHTDHTPITQAEIATATGWPLKKVRRFCGLQTWRGVPVEDIDTFRLACGITRHNEHRHHYYLKRSLDLNRTAAGLTHTRKRPGPANARALRLITSAAKIPSASSSAASGRDGSRRTGSQVQGHPRPSS
jgi:hypothetical protein